jgi:OFA family oxalate/formate antiporter-like MFS transporter
MKKLNRWVYAIVGVVTLLLAGLVYAWSVMTNAIGASRPEWTKGELSLAFTLVMTMFCIGCLIAGFLSKKVAPKYYVMLGAVLFLVGFFVASMAGTSLALLYIGFGVLCGLGAGFSYNAVMSTISAWFPDKQGLISGILLMGFGLSSFIVGKIFTAVTPSDGSDAWQTTFRVFAVVLFVVLMICSFFFVRPGADFVPPTTAKKKIVREPALDINSKQMIKQPSFWLYFIWAIVISAAGLVLVSQANGIAKEVGTTVDQGTIATVVGLISIMNGIGRVIFGGLFDKKGYRPTLLLVMILFIVASLILIGALKTGSFALIVVGFLVGGFAYGGVTPTNSAIISDFYGRTNFPLNFSLINTNLIIASFASTIAGNLYDKTQSYMSAIIMMIAVTVVGFIVFLGIKRPAKAE